MLTKIKYTISEYNLYTIIELSGIIEAYNSHDFKGLIHKLLNEGRVNIVIDFNNIDYVDSSAISVLIATHRRLEKVGGKLTLINVDDNTKDIFWLASLGEFFNIVAGRADLK